MSTYRFPLRGKIGVVSGLSKEITARLFNSRRQRQTERPLYLANCLEPLTEDQVRNLPVAHRNSA
jgi:hypothetical protein